MTQEHISTILHNPVVCPEDYCKDPFSLQIGNTTFEVNTFFNPQGRQSVLQQFQSLLLAKEGNVS